MAPADDVIAPVRRGAGAALDDGAAVLRAQSHGDVVNLELVPVGFGTPVAVIEQSDCEISLFLGPPEHEFGLTVDLYERQRARLLERLTEYVDAVVSGRCRLITAPTGSAGHIVFGLREGERRHSDNALPWPREPEGWLNHICAAYSRPPAR